jgi:hypothetical protein
MNVLRQPLGRQLAADAAFLRFRLNHIVGRRSVASYLDCRRYFGFPDPSDGWTTVLAGNEFGFAQQSEFD